MSMNSTPFSHTPVVVRFKMRSDIQSYHLGGMGCGTGVIGINLVGGSPAWAVDGRGEHLVASGGPALPKHSAEALYWLDSW